MTLHRLIIILFGMLLIYGMFLLGPTAMALYKAKRIAPDCNITSSIMINSIIENGGPHKVHVAMGRLHKAYCPAQYREYSLETWLMGVRN